MQNIKKKEAECQFDEQIYQTSPYYITSDLFWDGGICVDSSLKEKSNFYLIADRMSSIIKEIVLSLNEKVLVGKPICQFGEMYAKWADLKHNELFCKISNIIKKNQSYVISLPEDNSVIDLIVESNFKYLSYISLFLPDSNIVLQPTCHTEVLVYTERNAEIIKVLEKAVKMNSNQSLLVRVKQEQ